MWESAGHSVPMSLARRYLGDLLAASMRIPLVTIQKEMNVAELGAARHGCQPRPSWCSIFTKAYGKVVAARAPLRRIFLPFPWERMFEYRTNSADVATEVRVGDEDIPVPVSIVHPESIPLLEVDRLIALARENPLAHVARLRSALRLARLPRFIRRAVWWGLLNLSGKVRSDWFGTYAVTSVGNWGVESIRPIAPVISILHYGAIDAQGRVAIRLTYDHRVLDGSEPAQALNDMERYLKTDLLAELKSMHVAKPDGWTGV